MSDWYDHERNDHERPAEGLDPWDVDESRLNSRRLKPFCYRLPARNESLWKDFDKYLTHRNLSPSIAKANLWFPSDQAGDDQPRIVVPAAAAHPDNHFWQARLMGDGPRRYESPHGCRSGDACIVVYPMEFPLPVEAAVVEGPMCALAVAMTGRLGVATMGANPPEERLDLIYHRVRGTICSVIPDSDRQDLFIHVFSYLTNRGVQCRWLVPYAKDFADMSLSNRRRFF